MEKLIKPHGGYQGLKAFQMSEFVYDGTVAFTRLYLDRKSRTVDQMVQAARGGRQNIAEGSMASGTSSKMELKLIGVARASQEELLLDYRDYLRQRGFTEWPKDHEKAVFIRKLFYRPNRSYTTYESYIEQKGAENAANTLICVVNQTCYLLDKLLRQLESEFLEHGGFTERLFRQRTQRRSENGPVPLHTGTLVFDLPRRLSRRDRRQSAIKPLRGNRNP